MDGSAVSLDRVGPEGPATQDHNHGFPNRLDNPFITQLNQNKQSRSAQTKFILKACLSYIRLCI